MYSAVIKSSQKTVCAWAASMGVESVKYLLALKGAPGVPKVISNTKLTEQEAKATFDDNTLTT